MPELPIEISPADTKALLDKADAAVRLIDCREEDEWRICRIEGATLIPLSHFAEEASSKLQNTDQHLIVPMIDWATDSPDSVALRPASPSGSRCTS
jgi:rhodanese-related sulfurtransferase